MQEFTLTEDHLKLLGAANVSMDGCEWGGIGLDCKRPFGNDGMPEDVALILEWELLETEEGLMMPPGMRDRAIAIHAELETALEIVLVTQEFAPGRYVADDYGTNWTRNNRGGIA